MPMEVLLATKRSSQHEMEESRWLDQKASGWVGIMISTHYP